MEPYLTQGQLYWGVGCEVKADHRLPQDGGAGRGGGWGGATGLGTDLLHQGAKERETGVVCGGWDPSLDKYCNGPTVETTDLDIGDREYPHCSPELAFIPVTVHQSGDGHHIAFPQGQLPKHNKTMVKVDHSPVSQTVHKN